MAPSYSFLLSVALTLCRRAHSARGSPIRRIFAEKVRVLSPNTVNVDLDKLSFHYRASNTSEATAKTMPAISVRLSVSPKNKVPIAASINTIEME